MTSAVVNEKGKKLVGVGTCKQYPSDSDKFVRVKYKQFFRLTRLRDFWSRYNEGKNFSQSDAVVLLLDFYDQFYERCKDDFKRTKEADA